MYFHVYCCVFIWLSASVNVNGASWMFEKRPGDRCVVGEALGTCVHIYNCLSSVIDIKQKNHAPICSFRHKEPIVCCIDCEIVNDTRTAIVDKDDGIFFKNGQKARDNCLEHLAYLPPTNISCPTRGVERVWDHTKKCYVFERLFKAAAVGGKGAERARYPHMALLGYGPNEESAQWLCGGSLISDRFVLTAAHCLSSALGPVQFIAMGILKRSDPDELWQIYRVQRAIPHPDYEPPFKYHDIALLQTDRRVVYSKDVFPACIDYENAPHGTASATGWGKLGNHMPLADRLQEVDLYEFSDEDCRKNFPAHRLLKHGYDHNKQMCYGDVNHPRDTCEGDSGGPLQVMDTHSRCLHVVIGVTSYGRACGYAGDAGMYTRVYYYVPWIESIVWKD